MYEYMLSNHTQHMAFEHRLSLSLTDTRNSFNDHTFLNNSKAYCPNGLNYTG